MRGIFLNKTPIGFLLLADPVSGEEGYLSQYNGWYFLWRFMIAEEFQHKGYGTQSLDFLVQYVRSRPNATILYSSCEPGKMGPESFYLKYGFKQTGKKLGEENLICLDMINFHNMTKSK